MPTSAATPWARRPSPLRTAPFPRPFTGRCRGTVPQPRGLAYGVSIAIETTHDYPSRKESLSNKRARGFRLRQARMPALAVGGRLPSRRAAPSPTLTPFYSELVRWLSRHVVSSARDKLTVAGRADIPAS